MRIRYSPSRRGRDRVAINLAGMIDVTFLLLIYFMVTMILTAEEDQLSSTLQTQTEQSSSAQSDFEPQRVEVLRVNDEQSYRLGSRILTDRGALLKALEQLPKDVGVQILVYDGIGVDFAVAAIQIARDAGFEQVTYVPAK